MKIGSEQENSGEVFHLSSVEICGFETHHKGGKLFLDSFHVIKYF